jgi:CRP-like cAMP-binding protein
MFENLQKSISRFIQVEPSEFDFFTSCMSIRSLKKKEILLRADQNCRSIYFINKGCLRYYYLVDGEEKTAQFFFENGWFTDLDSFLGGMPAENFVDALEDTELLGIEKNDLMKLYEEIPKFERLGRILAENAYLGIRQKTKTLTTLDAEQRYLQLMKERPKIFERIPQHYIASYLNIKPQSLSRIRRQISSKKSKS